MACNHRAYSKSSLLCNKHIINEVTTLKCVLVCDGMYGNIVYVWIWYGRKCPISLAVSLCMICTLELTCIFGQQVEIHIVVTFVSHPCGCVMNGHIVCWHIKWYIHLLNNGMYVVTLVAEITTSKWKVNSFVCDIIDVYIRNYNVICIVYASKYIFSLIVAHVLNVSFVVFYCICKWMFRSLGCLWYVTCSSMKFCLRSCINFLLECEWSNVGLWKGIMVKCIYCLACVCLILSCIIPHLRIFNARKCELSLLALNSARNCTYSNLVMKVCVSYHCKMKLMLLMLYFSFLTLTQSSPQIKLWERKGLKDDRSESLKKPYKKTYLFYDVCNRIIKWQH